MAGCSHKNTKHPVVFSSEKGKGKFLRQDNGVTTLKFS